jgi:CRP/FNR family transcriptional regulator
MGPGKSTYEADLEDLFKNARGRSYPKNQLIQYQGDPLTHVYLVRKGYLKAYTILDNGDARTIMLLSAGDIFPIAFSVSMDWSRYKLRYFYQTLSPVELEVVPMESLREQIESDPFKMHVYMTYLAASNQAILNQLEVMKSKRAINKVEMLLPYLILKIGEPVRSNTYRLKIKLSHQEIADLTGVTRETTTTLIKQLENDKVLEQKRGTWIINVDPSMGLFADS